MNGHRDFLRRDSTRCSEARKVLVKVGLASDGFAELAARDLIETCASQRRLVWQLDEVALLVYSNLEGRVRLGEAIAALPAELRKIWTTAVVSIPTARAAAPIAKSLEEISAPRDLLSWAKMIAVALVAQKGAQRFGLAPSQPNAVDLGSDIEVTRLVAADSSRLYDALAIQRADIQAAQDRDTVWAERFAVASSAGFPVTILDRYATTGLARSLNQGVADGLSWFLGKLAAGPRAPVHLIAAAGGASDAGRLVADLRRLRPRLSGGGVTKLTATFAPGRCFEKRSHPRHVRFDPIAIGLDRGLSMFENSSCPHSMPCSRVARRTARVREEEVEHEAFAGFRRVEVW
jgi:hypothetical protein